MKDEHLRGELLQTEGEAKKTIGQAAGDPEAIEEARQKEACRRAGAAGDIQEVLFGEQPGAEDDADGII